MPTCFVIQPFDSGKFDKRFEQVYKSAISAAGLDPYRVDQDVHAEIPIDAIESGIRAAAVCIADITTDNPNVWYELGYAFASGTPVLMICSVEREGKKYPFDIQHRSILSYSSEAPGDFDTLRSSITARLKALVDKSATLKQLAGSDQVAPIAGLSQPELTVLAVLAASVSTPTGTASLWEVRRDTELANLTKLGFNLGVRRLAAKGFVETTVDTDYNGQQFEALSVTSKGWDWIDSNEANFVLRNPIQAEQAYYSGTEITDDDIPF